MKKLETKKASAKKPTKESASKTCLNVSPSAWTTWEKCALSLQTVKTAFKLERDEYAKAGVMLHDAIAKSLKSEPYTLAEGDDEGIVRFAVETVKSGIHPLSTLALTIEEPVGCVINGVNYYGTPDAWVIIDGVLIVIDYKTGWREVDAEENSQLKIYAHALAAKNKKVKKWKGVIINARFNSVSYASGDIESDYLLNTAKDVLARTKKKQFATGNHCAYCARLSTCAKLRAAIALWCKPGMIDGITREPEKLSEALRLAKPAEKLFEAIKKEAQLYIDLGGVIPGVTVEYTAGTRTWPRDMSGDDVARCINVDVQDMIETSFKSPAQAEKLGADKTAVNAIAIRPPRKGFKFI